MKQNDLHRPLVAGCSIGHHVCDQLIIESQILFVLSLWDVTDDMSLTSQSPLDVSMDTIFWYQPD